jgi:uncharacterized membrane protein YhhN
VALSPAVPSAGYLALAVADTTLAASPSPARRRLRTITKPLLMPALDAAFSRSLTVRGIGGGGLLRDGTVAAHALSGIGDMALLGTSDAAFLAGLGSFFGAHVASTTAFVSAGRPFTDREGWGGVAAAAGVFAALAPVMGRAAGRKSPSMRGPVVAYAGILSAMFAASTRLDPAIPRRARRKVVAGTALFLVSDTILATRRFLLHDDSSLGEAAVMAAYTAGQGLIAAGVADAIRARSDG